MGWSKIGTQMGCLVNDRWKQGANLQSPVGLILTPTQILGSDRPESVQFTYIEDESS